MQYEITLPADYDMGIVHRRVSDRGWVTDGLAGLGFKAYLVQERAHGAAVNQYAPFYSWADERGMSAFLGGAGFQGLCDSFGRPPVSHWVTSSIHRRGCLPAEPVLATKSTRALRSAEEFGEAIHEAETDWRALFEQAGVHAVCGGFDPLRWQIVTLALWETEPPLAIDATLYRLLHLSSGRERS